MSSTHEHDVIIVGGGPAASAAGRTLAGAGVRTLIVEKMRHPRPKPCGGLLSGRSCDAIARIFGADVLGRVTLAEVTGCRLFQRDGLIGEISDGPRMALTNRQVLDETLFRAAADAGPSPAGGCDVREGTAVKALLPSRGEVVLANGERLRARVIIAADGADSCLHRHGGVRPRRHAGFGLVAEAPIDVLRENDSPLPRIYFGLVHYGYGWVFPRGDVVNLGLGAPVSRGVDFRAALADLVGITCRDGTLERLNVRGHKLPLGNFDRHPGHANVLVAGDAAGMVEPLTGEGIAFALESGHLAACAAIEAIEADEPTQAGRRYNALIERPVLSHLRAARLARHVFYPWPFFPLAMKSLNRNPHRIRDFLMILAGRMTYAEFFGLRETRKATTTGR